MQKKSKINFWITSGKWIGIFSISILVVGVAFVFQAKLANFKTWGLLGIFLANLIGSTTIFIPAPAIVTVVAGGIVYPPILVALSATLGASIGDMISFLVGISGKNVFLKKEFHFYNKLVYFMRHFGAPTIFVFAFLPNPIFDAIGIVAGIVGYSPYKFFLWIFLGRLVRNVLLAFFGAKF